MLLCLLYFVGGVALSNIQAPAFGELPLIDEIFQNYPELLNRVSF